VHREVATSLAILNAAVATRWALYLLSAMAIEYALGIRSRWLSDRNPLAPTIHRHPYMQLDSHIRRGVVVGGA